MRDAVIQLSMVFALACGSVPIPSEENSPPDAAVLMADAATADATVTTTAAYLLNCRSMFAARITELQRESDPSFPEDCDAALVSATGRLTMTTRLCQAGESANACRERLYQSPPAVGQLGPGCAGAGCLRGAWVPRCADGGDACVEDEAVCIDGTRPLVYAEPGTPASGKWVFYLSGEGGPCSGDDCWGNYRYARVQNDQVFERSLSTLHPDYGVARAEVGTGIVSGTGAQNPFTGWNRVRWERCTDVASTGEETVTFGDGVGPGARVAGPARTRVSTLPVWQRGFDTWRAAFHMLTTTAGRDLDGDGDADLPSLADADTIVLAGSSDATTGLVYAGDRLAAELRAIAGPDVKVQIALDGLFDPSLDNERRYQPDAPAGFDLFSEVYAEGEACTLPDNGDGVANEACSLRNHQPNESLDRFQTLYQALTARGIHLDLSCEATHGAGAPQCFDRMHTLLHHVRTPVIVVADREDAVVGQSRPALAEMSTYTWSGPDVFGRRVLDQARDVANLRSTTDGDEGNRGVAGDFRLMLRKSRRDGQPWNVANHVVFGDNAKMAWQMTECDGGGGALERVSVADFVSDPSTGPFILEDAGHSAWVTGGSCIPAE
jgi:hypothetical protein